ncbi:hypothetical protein [Candidatus Lokiarchaeum ossiferum]
MKRKIMAFFILNLFTVSTAFDILASGCPFPENMEIDLNLGYGVEDNLTGWIDGKFKIRIYDDLIINWTDNKSGYRKITIWNDEGRSIFSDFYFSRGGDQQYVIHLDPNNNNYNNFQPGENYSLQICNLIHYFSPIVKSCSDLINFEIIKAKSQLQFIENLDFDSNNLDMGVYIIDKSGFPVDPHFLYKYEIVLANYYEPQKKLAFEPINLDYINPNTNNYEAITFGVTDINGLFEYEENKNNIPQNYIVRWNYCGSDLYESASIVDSLDFEHIFSPFDYTGPDPIGDDPSDGNINSLSNSSYSYTGLRKYYSWINVTESELQGFNLDDVSTCYYQFGVSEDRDSLYVGTISNFDFKGKLISPTVYYYGDEVNYASLSVNFEAFREVNKDKDHVPHSEIFNIDVLLLDEYGSILERQDLFNGNNTDFITKKISFNEIHFNEPKKFRIGFDISINVFNKHTCWDYSDEFYFCIREIDIDIMNKNAQWAQSSNLDDWYGYTFSENTKKIKYSELNNGEYEYLANYPAENCFNNTENLWEMPLNSLLDSSVPYTTGIQNYKFDEDPFTNSINTWGLSSNNDGFDFAGGYVSDIGSYYDYFSNGNLNTEGIEFNYLDFIRSGRKTYHNLPSFSFENVKYRNKWAGMSIPFSLSDLGDLYSYKELFIQYDVGSNPVTCTGLNYEIKTLLVKPDNSIIELHSQNHNHFYFKSFQHSLESLEPGNYQLVFIAETANWHSEKNIDIFFDNIKLKSTLEIKKNAYSFIANSGTVIPENNGPLYLDGEFTIRNQINFTENSINQSNLDLKIVYENKKIINSLDDGDADFAIFFIPIENHTIELDSYMITSEFFDSNYIKQDAIVDLNSLKGKNITHFKIRIKMHIPSSTRGYLNSADMFLLTFSNLTIISNDTINEFNYVSDFDLCSFKQITLDVYAKKDASCKKYNKNSAILATSMQYSYKDSYAIASVMSERTKSFGLSNTYFKGDLNLTIKKYIQYPTYYDNPINSKLYFDLYLENSNGNLVKIFTELIWESDISSIDYFDNPNINLSLNLDNVFEEFYNLGEEYSDVYVISYRTVLSSLNDGFIPKLGVEILKSSLVLTDQPPIGNWINLNSGDIITGNKMLQVQTLTHDCNGVRFLGSSDGGLTFKTIGETYVHDENWIFGYDFNTEESMIFPKNDEDFIVIAQFMDDYEIVNITSIEIIIDNSPPVISFGNSLINDDILVEPRNIKIDTNSTDIQYIELYAEKYDEEGQKLEKILIMTDDDGNDGWEFDFSPLLLEPSIYNFNAIAYDRAYLEGFCEATNLLVNWIDPHFYYPTPENNSFVKGTIDFYFSIGTPWIDNIVISTASISTFNIEDAAFQEYVVLNKNSTEDIYHFDINSKDVFGEFSNGYYYIEFEFNVNSYSQKHYYWLYFDNQPIVCDISISDTVKINEHTIDFSLYQPFSGNEFSNKVNVLGEDNWIADSFPLNLEIIPAYYEDLVYIQYYLEIYKNNDMESLGISENLNYSYITQDIYKYHKNDILARQLEEFSNYYPSQITDGYSFLLDVSNGILHTLGEIIVEDNLIGNNILYDFNQYPYLAYIIEFSSNGFPIEYVNNQNEMMASSLTNLFDEAFNDILNDNFQGAYDIVLKKIKPILTGLTTNEKEIPWTTPERILISEFNNKEDIQPNPRIDLSHYPDCYFSFAIDTEDKVGNKAIYSTELYLLDKGNPKSLIVYPEFNEQVILPVNLNTNEEISLNFSIYTNDMDIAELSFKSAIAYTEFLEKNLDLSLTQIMPNHLSEFQVVLDYDTAYSLLNDFTDNPTIFFEIEIIDQLGKTSILESEFSCVEQYDYNSPNITIIQAPNNEITYTGGFDLILDIDDVDENGNEGSGVKYIELWVNEINNNFGPGEINFPIMRWHSILEQNKKIYPEIFNNFLGLVLEPENDGYYHINPWNMSGRYMDLSNYSNGDFEFYIKVYDNNWNYEIIEINANIIMPQFNIKPNYPIHTDGTSNSLNFKLIDFGNSILDIEYILHNDDMSINAISSDGIFTGLNNQTTYYFDFKISQLDGSIISNNHTFEYPEKISKEIYGISSNTIQNYYLPYSIPIDNSVPYEFSFTIQNDDVIQDYYVLEANWLGEGIVEEKILYVDGKIADSVEELSAISINNNAKYLINTYELKDGNHNFSLEVLFNNQNSENSSIVNFIVDNSLPLWISSGFWINNISQYSIPSNYNENPIVYTNNQVEIQVNAYDPQSKLKNLEIWIQNDEGLSEIYKDIPLETSIVDYSTFLTIEDLNNLFIFKDGNYIVWVKLIGESGLIESQIIELSLMTELPTGNFINPYLPTNYENQIINLDFKTVMNIELIKSVEFFIQTQGNLNDFELNIDLLKWLGYGSIEMDSSDEFYYSFDYINDEYHDTNATFWVKIIDRAGNVNYIRTSDNHYIILYKIELDNFNGILYLDDNENINGNLINYENSSATAELSIFNGISYIPLEGTETLIGDGGSFTINWVDNNQNIPTELTEGFIPINCIEFSDYGNYQLYSQNFVQSGKFNNSDNYQIALITGNSNPFLYIFDHSLSSIYEWDVKSVEIGNIGSNVIQVNNWDVDNDGFNELVILSDMCLTVIDWNTEYAIWQINTYPFSNNNHINDLSITEQYPINMDYNSTHIIIGFKNTIYSFSIDANLAMELHELWEIPSGEELIQFTYNEIIGFATLLIITKQSIYYLKDKSWNLIFSTSYNLLSSVFVENLDLDPENEIIFGVLSNFGTDIVQAKYNYEFNGWEFVSTVLFSNLNKIYDIKMGHLSNTNLGNIVIASNEGLSIVNPPYLEKKQEYGLDPTNIVTTNESHNGIYEDYYSDINQYKYSAEKGYMSAEFPTSITKTENLLSISAPQASEQKYVSPKHFLSTATTSNSRLSSKIDTGINSNNYFASSIINSFSGGSTSEFNGLTQDELDSYPWNTKYFGYSFVNHDYIKNSYFNTESSNTVITTSEGAQGYFEDYNNLKGSIKFSCDFNEESSIDLESEENYDLFPRTWVPKTYNGRDILEANGWDHIMAFDDLDIRTDGVAQNVSDIEFHIEVAKSDWRDVDDLIYKIIPMDGIIQELGDWHDISETQTFDIPLDVESLTVEEFNDLYIYIADNLIGRLSFYTDTVSLDYTLNNFKPDDVIYNGIELKLTYGDDKTVTVDLPSNSYVEYSIDDDDVIFNYNIPKSLINSYEKVKKIEFILDKPSYYDVTVDYNRLIGDYDNSNTDYWDNVVNADTLNHLKYEQEFTYTFGDEFIDFSFNPNVNINFKGFSLASTNFGSEKTLDSITDEFSNMKFLSTIYIKDTSNIVRTYGDPQFSTINNGKQCTMDEFTFYYDSLLANNLLVSDQGNYNLKFIIITEIILEDPSNDYIFNHDNWALKPIINIPVNCLNTAKIRLDKNSYIDSQNSFTEKTYQIFKQNQLDLIKLSDTGLRVDFNSVINYNMTAFQNNNEVSISEYIHDGFLSNFPLKISVSSNNALISSSLSIKISDNLNVGSISGSNSIQVIYTKDLYLYPDEITLDISGSIYDFDSLDSDIYLYLKFEIFNEGVNGKWMNSIDSLTSTRFDFDISESNENYIYPDTLESLTHFDYYYNEESKSNPRAKTIPLNLLIEDKIINKLSGEDFEQKVQEIRKIELSLEGSIAHYLWNNPESGGISSSSSFINQNLFNPEFHDPMEGSNWISDNAGKSTICIQNELTTINLLPSPNIHSNQFIFNYSISPYSESNYELIDSIYKEDGNYYLRYLLIIDQNNYILENHSNFDSSLIKIDISKIHLTYSVINGNESIRESNYEEIQEFRLDIDDSNDLDTLDISSLFSINISSTLPNTETLFATDEDLIWGNNPISYLALKNKYTAQYDILLENSVEMVISDNLRILSSNNLKLYLYENFEQYLQYDSTLGLYFIEGRNGILWSLRNERFETLKMNCEVIDSEVQIELESWNSDVELLNNGKTKTVSIADADGDNDQDIILDTSTVIYQQKNEATYAMKISTFDNDDELICDMNFLAIQDRGAPHPEFFGHLSEIVEFGRNFSLNVVDYSTDLTDIYLFYSYNETGPFIELDHQSITETQNYFRYEIDSENSSAYLNEGKIFFNFTCTDDSGLNGSTILSCIIDRSPIDPLFSVIDFEKTILDENDDEMNCISVQSNIEIDIPYEAETESDLDYIKLFLICNDEIIWKNTYFPSDLVRSENGYELQFNIYENVIKYIMNYNISDTLRFEWQTVDKACNIHEFKKNYTFNLDSDFEIFLCNDDGLMLNQNEIDFYYYNEYINGKVVDSFGQPLPKDFEFDLCLDGLILNKTKITNNYGSFNAKIVSCELYSNDLRYNQDVIINGIDGKFEQDKSIQMGAGLSSRYSQIDAVNRLFLESDKGNIVLKYENMDYSEYNILDGFEGFHFDLFIPAAVSYLSGSTFSEIQLQFSNASSSQSNENDTIFTYTLNSREILDLLDKDPNVYTYYDMHVKHLSIDVPFYELDSSNFYNEFDLSKITAVRIVGQDNLIHPGINFQDATFYRQSLMCGGLFLIDLVNNATMYYSENARGLDTPREYQISAQIQNSNIMDIYASSDFSIQIGRINTDFLNIVDIFDDIHYSDIISINGIGFDNDYVIFTNDMVNSYLCLKSHPNYTSDEYINIGVSFPIGIKTKTDFMIIAQPNHYYNLDLIYSGSSFFESSVIPIIEGDYEIQKKNLSVDLFRYDLDEQFEISIDRNQTSIIRGQLIDNDGKPMFEFDTTSSENLSFYMYNDYILEFKEDREIFSNNNVLLGIYDRNFDYWIENSQIKGGFFNFTLNNTNNGNIPLNPGRYIFNINFTGNNYYNSINRTIIIDVEASDVLFEMKDPETDRWVDLNFELDPSITFSDSKSYTFRLNDAYTNKPISNVPIWLQISLVPYAYDSSKLENFLSDCYGDYLIRHDNVPEELRIKKYIQDKTSKPIAYPYFDEKCEEIRTFGPLYYQMVESNSEGIVVFNIEGDVFQNVMDYWYEKLKFTPISVEDINLYIRAFYSSSFDVEFMQIQETTYYEKSLPIDLFNNNEWIYDYSDEEYNLISDYLSGTLYTDPYHKSGYVDGIITIEKEDTMLMSAYQEVVGAGNFTLCTQVIEADVVNGQYIPEKHDDSNFIEKYGLSSLDKFAITMEIYDHTNLNKYISGQHIGFGKYVNYNNDADDLGVVEYNNSEAIYGVEWTNLVPNYYNIHYSVAQPDNEPYTDEISYSKTYKMPINTSVPLLLKSQSTFSIDNPSHVYSIPQFIESLENIDVSYLSENSEYIDSFYDGNYPIIKTDISISADSLSGENYNNTDEVVVNILADNVVLGQYKVSNFSEELIHTKHFELPLKILEGRIPDISFRVDFVPLPEKNIDWDEEREEFASNDAADINWVDYRDSLIHNAWVDYQIRTNYDIKIDNFVISDSNILDNAQNWNIYDDVNDEWIYSNDTTKQSDSIVRISEMGKDSSTISSTNEFTKDLISTINKVNILQYRINQDCADWSSDIMQISDSMTFNVSEIFKDVFYVERINRNCSISYADPVSEENVEDVYQTFNGFMLSDLSNCENSIRTANFYNSSELDFASQSAIYAGLNQGDVVKISIKDIYMPYQSQINWSLIAPKFDSVDISNIDIQLDFKIKGTTEEYFSNGEIYYHYLNAASYNEDITKYFVDMSQVIPEDFWSKFVDIEIIIHAITTDDLVQLYLLDSLITGNENIIKMSNVYPTALRARMFSTNLMYFYTSNAFDIGATVTENININDQNDILYRLEEDDDPYTNNLIDILNVWDWNVYVNPPEDDIRRYIDLYKWHYNEETKTYEELNELTDYNQNLQTYFDFADDDNDGLSMVKMKFKEAYMEDLTEPKRFSGLLRLYNNDYDNPEDPENSGSILSEMTSRKITVLLNPETWEQQAEMITLKTSSTSTSDTYRTDLGNKNIDLEIKNEFEKQSSLTYFLEAGINDVNITDWSEEVKIKNAPTTTAGNLKYDLENYQSYYDIITGLPASAELDSSYLFIELEKQSNLIYEFDMNIDGIYGINSHLDKGEYEFLDLPFYIDNCTYIENIQFSLYDSSTLRYTELTEISDLTDYYSRNKVIDISGIDFDTINFKIQFKDIVTAYGKNPNITIGGLGLFDEKSVGYLNINLRETESSQSDTYTTYSHPLTPTIFNPIVAPNAKKMDLILNDEMDAIFIKELSIKTPERANAELNIFELAINDKLSSDIEESVMDNYKIYYSYKFDEYQNEMMKEIYSVYSEDFGMPDWISTNGLKVSELMKWSNQYSIDTNGDGDFDITIQIFDGEGKGSDIYETLPDGTEITYFNNGIQDTMLYDIGNDGIWNILEKSDTIISSFNVTDPADNENGYYYVSEYKFEYEEIWEDLTGDGIFNIKTQEYRTSDLKSPIPNYREFSTINSNGDVESYFEVHISDDDWSDYTYGKLTEFDFNGDGVFEYSEKREDLFPNTKTVLESNDENLIYETYTKTYIDSSGNKTIEEGIEFLQNLTFICLGPDPVDEWNGGEGTYERVLAGEFVILEDIPVNFDPRSFSDIPNSIRLDEHGTIAWYDSDNNGHYEIAFIFTQESWQEQIAVAAYQSSTGKYVVHTQYGEFENSNDTITAFHWLSDYYDFTDIMDVGWDAAYDDHNRKMGSADFWITQIMDTLLSCLTMFIVGALAPATFGASLLLTTVINSLFQKLLRPLLVDLMEEFGVLTRDRSHILGGKDESGLKHDPIEFLEEVGQSFVDDWAIFGKSEGIPYYTERAYFTDVDPFTIDQNKEQFSSDPNVDPMTQHENKSVWVEYKVPQLWCPTGRGDYNILSTLDIKKHIDNSGIFSEDVDPELAYLGIRKGVPNSFGYALKWYLEQIHAGVEFDDPAEVVIKRKMDEDSTRHRRIMHQFFYRDAPWDTEELWDSEIGEENGFTTKNYINGTENTLIENSLADNRKLIYKTNEFGQPTLTAAPNTTLNYSDSIIYELDYLQMCMISKYRTAYEAGEKYNAAIFFSTLTIQIVQTGLAILAGYAGGALHNKIKWQNTLSKALGEEVKLQFSEVFNTIWKAERGIRGFIGEIFEEMVLEEAVSSTFIYLGFSEGLSNLLGESISFSTISSGFSKLTSLGKSQTSATPKKTNSEIVKSIQTVNQFVFGSQTSSPSQAGSNSELIRSKLDSKKSSKTAKYMSMSNFMILHQAAHTLDMTSITKLQGYIDNNAVNDKMGGSLNLARNLKLLSSVLRIPALEYTGIKSKKALAKFEITMKNEIFQEILEEGGGDPSKIIANKLLWEMGKLGLGKDGKYRYQKMQSIQYVGNQKMLTEIVPIIENGEISSIMVQLQVDNDIVGTLTLDEYLALETTPNSLSELILQSDEFNMVDPESIGSTQSGEFIKSLPKQAAKLLEYLNFPIEDLIRGDGKAIKKFVNSLGLGKSAREFVESVYPAILTKYNNNPAVFIKLFETMLFSKRTFLEIGGMTIKDRFMNGQDSTIINKMKELCKALGWEFDSSRNVAFLEFDLKHLDQENNIEGYIASKSQPESMNWQPTFDNEIADIFEAIDNNDGLGIRYTDTERKMLMDLFFILNIVNQNKYIEGSSVILYTRNPPCRSCQKIIKRVGEILKTQGIHLTVMWGSDILIPFNWQQVNLDD